MESICVTEYFLDESKLEAFFSRMHRGPVYGTVDAEKRSRYEKLTDDMIGQLTFRTRPPVESLKTFMFPVKERVAVYPSAAPADDINVDLTEAEPQVIAGARACDIRALAIMDTIFTAGDFVDPFYQKRRNCSVIITTDCSEVAEGCFCNLMDGKPFAETGFDLNFTPVTGGYIVVIGSEVGKELVLEKANLFIDVDPEKLQERTALRGDVLDVLEKKNEKYKLETELKELVRKQPADVWSRLCSGCVECGACSFICPTCHCFLLYDQLVNEHAGVNERLKAWDSCVFANFAKMAGVGGMKPTPRPKLPNRLENRIRHKFEWMLENLDCIGCIGCGRCQEGCMGGSSIPEVLKELENENK